MSSGHNKFKNSCSIPSKLSYLSLFFLQLIKIIIPFALFQFDYIFFDLGENEDPENEKYYTYIM